MKGLVLYKGRQLLGEYIDHCPACLQNNPLRHEPYGSLQLITPAAQTRNYRTQSRAELNLVVADCGSHLLTTLAAGMYVQRSHNGSFERCPEKILYYSFQYFLNVNLNFIRYSIQSNHPKSAP